VHFKFFNISLIDIFSLCVRISLAGPGSKICVDKQIGSQWGSSRCVQEGISRSVTIVPIEKRDFTSSNTLQIQSRSQSAATAAAAVVCFYSFSTMTCFSQWTCEPHPLCKQKSSNWWSIVIPPKSNCTHQSCKKSGKYFKFAIEIFRAKKSIVTTNNVKGFAVARLSYLYSFFDILHVVRW
jgi:hypothetical protein